MSYARIKNSSNIYNLFFIVIISFIITYSTTFANIFNVTNTNDSGPGSLRQAILDANTNPGMDSIYFKISGPGPYTIQPLSHLPVITSSILIDGYTQLGASPNTNSFESGGNAVLKIELDGTNIEASAITITAGGSTIRGLVINRFGDSGIAIIGTSAKFNRITGNFIGTDINGTAALANLDGIWIGEGAGENTIGGNSPGDRNVISGNNIYGVSINNNETYMNWVEGNYIGSDVSGLVRLANKVGGVLTSERTEESFIKNNLISGNGEVGVRIENSWFTWVQDNYIGTDRTGENRLGNGYDLLEPQGAGVAIYNNEGNAINGNVISGNYGYGIWIAGTPLSSLIISNNKIGTTFNSSGALPNDFDGVYIDQSANQSVVQIIQNKMAYNGGAGVSVKQGKNIDIRDNQIYLNNGLGIDLGSDGVTVNDFADIDNGPNTLLNFPILYNACSKWGYDSFPPQIYTSVKFYISGLPISIQIFKNGECDPSGFGEGKIHILDQDIPVNFFDDGGINELVIDAVPGDYLTATATDPQHNTSEFSPCTQVEWQLNLETINLFPLQSVSSNILLPPGSNYDAGFYSSWSGSDVVMTITSPSGRIITRSTSDDDVKHENGPAYEYYLITNPEPGNWTIELFGADLPAEGEEVFLSITSATEEPIQTMTIDIKPDDDNNLIDCTNPNGIIPVAIISDEDFDATTIDTATVRFGKYGTEAGVVNAQEIDVDNDGDTDLLLDFNYSETKLDCDSEFAVMLCSRPGGKQYTGADFIELTTDIKTINPIPEKFVLQECYPNPFNTTTTIRYDIPQKSMVELKIFDFLGSEIATLVNEQKQPGRFDVIFDASSLSSGIYFYRINAGEYVDTKKMIYLK